LIDVGTAVGYLLLDTKGFQSGFSSAMKDMKTFQDESATVSDKFSAMGSALTSVGGTLTKSVTLPLVGVGAAVMKVGSDFEAQMSRVQAISGATGDELKALTDQAIDLGATTAFSAGEAAEGMENLASAGFNTQEIMSAMPGLLDLAASSGAELGTASEIAASAIRGFGLAASDAGHVADVFAEAAARTNAQTEDMGEAMKYIAPVAKAMGQSLEETAAAVGIMSDAGIKGSQAGTSLRSALSRLAKPTEVMLTKMGELGLSFYDAQGNMLPLNGIIEQLETNMAGLTQEQRNNALITLFGQESLSGMLALMERGPEELRALTESFEDCDGAAAEMAETMLDNTKGSVEEMMGSIETLAIRLQQVMAPAVTAVVQKITEFVNKLSSLSPETLQMIVTIAGVVAALGPLLLIIGKLSSAIGSIISLVGGAGGLSAVLTALTGPIGIVIAAIAALVTAWVTDFGGIREKTAEIFEAIKSVFTTAWEFISNLWNENFLNIQNIAQTVWSNIELIFSTAFNLISNVFQIFAALFQGDWDTAWNLVKERASLIWETIKTLFSNFLNLLVDTLIHIGVRLLQAAKDTFNKVKEGFQNVWDAIKTWFSEVVNDPVNTIKGIGSALFEAGKSIFTSLWDGMKSIWESITSWVSNAVNWISEKVQFWKDESAKVSAGDSPGTITVSGSYASGLDYVPSDRIVKVHEGEAILTKQENANRNNGSGGDIYNFYSPVALTPTKAAQEFKRAKQELALGFV
jgi:TP901 family phage tail tape measure protein